MVHLKVIDAAESTVIKYHDVNFLSLLHDGHDLTVEHLEAGVTNYAVYFVVRLCEFYAKGSGNFVSHAGISVLCMISATFVCSPHTLHTAWKRAACCDDGCIFVDGSVDCCKCCCLCDLSVCKFYILRNGTWISCLDQRLKVISCVLDASQTLHLFIPCSFCFLDLICVCGFIFSCTKFLCKCFYGNFCIAHCFYRIHLVCVESAVVDAYELNILVLEQMLGTCCKVRHSGTDGDYHVCVFTDDVGSIGSCYTDTAKAVWIAGLAGALSGLCLTKGDLELLTEFLNGFSCF